MTIYKKPTSIDRKIILGKLSTATHNADLKDALRKPRIVRGGRSWVEHVKAGHQ